MNNLQKNIYILSKAGFGVSVSQLKELESKSSSDLINEIFAAAKQKANYILAVEPSTFLMQMEEIKKNRKEENKKDNDIKKVIRKTSVAAIAKLNTMWLEEMEKSSNPLLEKMCFFWHGHFACRSLNAYHQQRLFNAIRQNALGSFKTLLLEVSKSAAMLAFLNNNKNKKRKPNENFAREVMELFTLGRGNYTETDIKEAAKAFTGWDYNNNAEFEFNENQHDDGVKTIFGKTNNFSGEDVLNLILSKKEAAIFLTKKIYSFFVSDTINEERINKLATAFFNSGYNILELLKNIFTSNWFFSSEALGTKIKSPIELLVGLKKVFPNTVLNNRQQIIVQKALGQVLFYPPNVAGWPGGKTWIDSSTLVLRLNLARLFVNNNIGLLRAKTDDDVEGGMKEENEETRKSIFKRFNNQLNFEALAQQDDWRLIINNFSTVERGKLFTAIVNTFLTSDVKAPSKNAFLINEESRDNFIISTVLYCMSLPEYQLI